MVGPDTAFILSEDHVHHPVEAVFDGPVAADRRPQKMRQDDQGGNIIAGLMLDLPFDLACAFNDGDGVQTGPVVAFAQPFHVVDDSGDPGFDPAVIGVDGLRAADLGVRGAMEQKTDLRTQGAVRINDRFVRR